MGKAVVLDLTKTDVLQVSRHKVATLFCTHTVDEGVDIFENLRVLRDGRRQALDRAYNERSLRSRFAKWVAHERRIDQQATAHEEGE